VPGVPESSGNTNNSPGSKTYVESPYKGWCFTVFNYNDDMIKAMCASCAKNDIEKYMFGREICPDTKRPHLQCFIWKESKTRWLTVFRGVLPISTNRRPCKGNLLSNITYCGKDKNIICNFEFLTPYVKKKVELRPWQAKAVDIIRERCKEDRMITWFYERKGGVGKSILVDYLVTQFQAIALNGAKRHCLSTAFKNPNCPLWIFDIPRTNKGGVSYESIEALRNGLWYSGFSDCTGMIRLPFNPCVIILANCRPKSRSVTVERWDIRRIEGDNLINVPWDADGSSDDDDIY